MALTLTDVKRIAHLARLELADAEAEHTPSTPRALNRSPIRSSRSRTLLCVCAKTL
jgi:hypothetical protein